MTLDPDAYEAPPGDLRPWRLLKSERAQRSLVEWFGKGILENRLRSWDAVSVEGSFLKEFDRYFEFDRQPVRSAVTRGVSTQQNESGDAYDLARALGVLATHEPMYACMWTGYGEVPSDPRVEAAAELLDRELIVLTIGCDDFFSVSDDPWPFEGRWPDYWWLEGGDWMLRTDTTWGARYIGCCSALAESVLKITEPSLARVDRASPVLLGP